jgi:NADH:ubiquinone oxidoreductase subunit K
MISTGTILLSAGLFLFFAGLVQCLTSRKFLGFLFGIEIMINAANLNLAGFLAIQPYRTDIQPLMVMIMALAAVEIAVGLAIFTWISGKEKAGDFRIL